MTGARADATVHARVHAVDVPHGRVIRLRSPHDDVLLTTMLLAPGELERLLGLEATMRARRIRAKVAATGVHGMESEVIQKRGLSGPEGS